MTEDPPAGKRAEQLRAALAVHGACEFRSDLAGTMATVAASPTYVWYIGGVCYRFSGRTAVGEMYRRLFAVVTPYLLERLVGDPAYRFGESHAVIEADHRFGDGKTERVVRIMAVVDFEGTLVAAERTMIADPVAAAWMIGQFDRDFHDIVGMTRIGSS